MGLEGFTPFSVEVQSGGAVVARGDIDLASAPQFEAALRDAAAQSTGDLLVDLSGVEFMDSSGMNVLVRLFKTLDPEARSLRLLQVNERVRRALEVGGVGEFAKLG